MPDRGSAGAELKRVLRPGGCVVVRTTVRERLDSIVYEYRPKLRALDARRFPSEAAIIAGLTVPGSAPPACCRSGQPVQPSLQA